MGISNHYTDQEYDNLSVEDLKHCYERIGESQPEMKEDAIHKLRSIERTRYVKIRHDHSDILNHSYICFMVSWLYDPVNFLTDKEYMEKYPYKKNINIQSAVERPKLYLFGRSGNFKIKLLISGN